MKTAVAITIGIALCAWLAYAAPSDEQLMAFHPITQAQYDAILGLTEGKPVISEARLIASGIAALKGLAAGFKFGFSTGWLPSIISNFIGTERNATKDVLDLPDGYPLCVVKQQEEGVDDNYNDDHSIVQRQPGATNKVSVVKCVVVVKQDPSGSYEHQTMSTAIPPQIDYSHYEQAQEQHNYPYPPWYNAPYTYPQYQYNSYQNAQSYEGYMPSYRVYPNTYDSAEQQDYYQHYAKPQYTQKYKAKSHKPITKNRKRHPEPVNYHDYTLPPTRKRSKTKRDQYPTHTHQQHYPKISSYPEGAYQPAAYPQINYQNQYPKVSYSPSYNYPSPVYVRKTTDAESGQQSEESHESEEYLKSRID